MYDLSQIGVNSRARIVLEVPMAGAEVAGMSERHRECGGGKQNKAESNSAVAGIPIGGGDRGDHQRQSDHGAVEVKSSKVKGGELCTVLRTKVQKLLTFMLICNH
jgi:hypothetical protein